MEIIVGLLYRRQVRRFLVQAEFYNHVSRWTEIKGFSTSKFLINNPSQEVYNYFQNLIDQIAIRDLNRQLEESRLQKEKEMRQHNRWFRRLYRWVF